MLTNGDGFSIMKSTKEKRKEKYNLTKGSRVTKENISTKEKRKGGTVHQTSKVNQLIKIYSSIKIQMNKIQKKKG